MATKETGSLTMKAHYSDELGLKLIGKKLSQLIPLDREIVYVCVGTDRSTGDSLAPFVGMMLQQQGIENVFGTIDFPVHAMNLKSTIYNIEQSYNNPFIIAIDACLGRRENIGKVTLDNTSLCPGAGVKKELPSVGNLSLTGVVNISDFMEYQVLENTRLSVVMHLASSITKVILDALNQNVVYDKYELIK